jgi:D-glycero-D-manno-heptose 1,7-bisphosphate phosphatase
MRSKKNTAVFLDRDGTLNEEVGYLDRLEKLKLYDNAAEAIRCINEIGMKTVVITNQSGVARGYFTEEFVKAVHRQIQDLLNRRGAFIDAFYYCPHHPEAAIKKYQQTCSCRKPEPGMLITAAHDLDIDLERSYTVGDMIKDIQVAGRVGAKGILVKTGYGMNVLDEVLQETPDEMVSSKDAAAPIEHSYPDHIATDILDAVKWIMRDRRK